MPNEGFVRHGLIITFMSILMEVFGQTFISVITSVGYFMYFS